MNQFVDTHCHIHFPDYQLDPETVYNAAIDGGVTRMVCVGCTLDDSERGVQFAQDHDAVWASIGLHPHEAQRYVGDAAALDRFAQLASMPKVVAIGECGLDYCYNHSPKAQQQELLEFQLELAKRHKLPLIFHIRDAFDDFWPIFDQFEGLKGVVHSFSATELEVEQILSRGLYVGLNGIMTFTKDSKQLDAARAIPLDKLVLETDAPFLTPTPYRGTICEPKHVCVTAEFLANLRGETLEELAAATTRNAIGLLSLN